MWLITGTTGLVGGEVLPRLEAARPGRRTYLLKRPEADLTRPSLGLDSGPYAELQSSVTAILHCAADTRFHLPLDQARAVNTEGTRRLLEFARGCPRLEKFVHLSTVYVAGLTTGCLPEEPLPRPAVFCNTYQQSKYEAEELVLAAAGGLPAAIVRLSSLAGDSRTGAIRRFTYVHQLIRLLPRNVLPVAPCDSDAPLDLIPTDWAAGALVWLLDHAFEPGRVYHLCAGPEASLTAGEMLDLTLRELDGAGRAPRLVSLAEYRKFVEESRRSGDRLLNELLRVLDFFLPHLGLYQAFDNRRTREALAPSGMELPPIRSYYPRVVRYCLSNARLSSSAIR